jgi:hypothetical protein
MDLKLKVVTSFPASVLEGGGVRLDKKSGKWTFSLDYSAVPPYGYDVLTGADGAVLTGEDGAILMAPSLGPLLTGADGQYLKGSDGQYLHGAPVAFTPSATQRILLWDSQANNYFTTSLPLIAPPPPNTIVAETGYYVLTGHDATLTYSAVTHVPTYYIYGF